MACTGGYVLVVDDDVAIRRALAEILRDDYGHDIKTASDGYEALDVLESSAAPSLILVDLMMPRMDGERFIERKSDRPDLARIPFCIMTASGRGDAALGRLASITTQAFPVLRKPFDLDQLLSVVERYC